VKLVLPGGAGLLGTYLATAFAREGHDVVVLSRAPKGNAAVRQVAWDGATLGPWATELDGADAVINLAGRSVNCRYTPTNRRAIMDSRVDSTRVVGKAIAASASPPPVWLQASTATIYAHRYDAPNDESTGVIGGAEPDAPESWRFSVEVARAWERTLEEAATPRTRKVALRTAIVMSPDRGGAFDVLLSLVRRGLGGTSGNGRQYVSWIHFEDLARAVTGLLESDLAGPVNVAAPSPIPNAEFMRALREAWGIRAGLPATRWMLELGSIFLRTESELVLKSRRVVPGRLVEDGFTFKHPSWPEAALDLCEQWRSLQLGDPAEAQSLGRVSRSRVRRRRG
jgi:uncharacterized protein